MMKKIPNVPPLVSSKILPIVSCDTNDNDNGAQYQQQLMNGNRQDCATKSKNHDVTPTESTTTTNTTEDEDPLLLSSLSSNNDDNYNNDATDEMKRNSILRKKI